MQQLRKLRDHIASSKHSDENVLVEHLLNHNPLRAADRMRIEDNAVRFVERTRKQRDQRPLLDAFLQEYGLSNQEGIALMCLAEALLRIPDAETRDALIADKIAPGEWMKHIGKAESMFVNASTWGLMLTGQVVAMAPEVAKDKNNWLGKLTNRIGEPVIRTAMLQAMRIMGAEFVLGQTIDEAMTRGKKAFGKSQIYSFDMLGEGARTYADAERHFEAYLNAIHAVGNAKEQGNIYERSGISIKLSALHPRYEFAHRAQVLEELGTRILVLANLAASYDIKMSIDAEEADRLELSLDLFEALAREPSLKEWQGLGLVVQAYGKRALPVIEWLGELAKETGRRFMVRLVKGAYWDMEIKHAQEEGFEDFPVFTRKATTDLSYMRCAQALFRHSETLFAQFATHNAHSVAAILHLSGGDYSRMEFQRLHGMGQLVYKVVQEDIADFPPVRIYAPVGGHEDLLAYLVRRLLENGANSSFVNRFMDEKIAAREVVADPLNIVQKNSPNKHRHGGIRLPKAIFGERENASGIDLSSALDVSDLHLNMACFSDASYVAQPIYAGAKTPTTHAVPVINPANHNDQVGQVFYASKSDIQQSFDCAKQAQIGWDALRGNARADILSKAADMIQADYAPFMCLLIREAGKTHADAVSEIRETVDFLRYYADRARKDFEDYEQLPGPTGEANSIGLHGRGVFVCISPWNFPLAIFMGQVAAALAAGNAVIAKPAEQTTLVAAKAAQILYDAGVPKSVFALLPGDGAVGAEIISHADVSGIAFTGGTDTARRINQSIALKDGPIIPFIAETGGQNVMFVDSTALLEQVTDDVVASAFYSAGQRCSALRVLYLQEEIADKAIAMICGAMDELRLGDPAKLKNDIGPIIDKNAAQNLNAHAEKMQKTARFMHKTTLPKGCEAGTFVAPHLIEIDNMEQLGKEQFGPMLHVIRYKASELDTILNSAFSGGYGLTFGVHTRMDHRWMKLFAAAPVGNSYINRNMVGAVVGSQPFGGQGLSGTGFKAGGPRYLYKFAVEKVLTVNIMASGGNADLLTLNAD